VSTLRGSARRHASGETVSQPLLLVSCAPLSSECGTHKTRFWPWLSGEVRQTFKLSHPGSLAGCQSILKLTCCVSGTNPSSFDRTRTRAHQNRVRLRGANVSPPLARLPPISSRDGPTPRSRHASRPKRSRLSSPSRCAPAACAPARFSVKFIH